MKGWISHHLVGRRLAQTASRLAGSISTKPDPVSLERSPAAARIGRFLIAAVLVSGVCCLQPVPALAQDAADGNAEDQADSEQLLMTIPRDPVGILKAMGWKFYVPFAGASVIALWFSIERVVVLRRGRVLPRPFIQRFLQHLEQGQVDRDTALDLCEQNGSPVAYVFAHGIHKWGKPSVEVEQAIIDGGERQVSQLRKHLRVINGVATVTPLIGLLGTVMGMIQAFGDIAGTSATGRAQVLSVGIAVALYTTATGLIIAIPALIMYMYLAGRVDALVMEMDHLAQDVVHLISAEGLAFRDSVSAGGKPKT